MEYFTHGPSNKNIKKTSKPSVGFSTHVTVRAIIKPCTSIVVRKYHRPTKIRTYLPLPQHIPLSETDLEDKLDANRFLITHCLFALINTNRCLNSTSSFTINTKDQTNFN